ncbi:hypothetical protein BV22DRAFT_1009885 [Leucogyrophana mollusca]|uniref:Uncharacterized protein n=1 Tax=Leucogyrophana mollusca TaxID=85980 RepID=A0ACB8BKE5_9AGAM|nr:hypothetical protein BV22DRAFT_1009885 [Leucogyrophana mollusca]
MSSAVQQGPSASAPGDGSRTLTLQDSQPRPEDDAGPGEASTVGTLRLRGGPRRARQRVAWGEDVIDNEGCGKKKSKICCIYHKPKRFDESSSEESSDPDSDSDSSCNHDHSGHRTHSPPRQGRHPNGRNLGLVTRDARSGGIVYELSESDSDHNTYERAPKGKKGKT